MCALSKDLDLLLKKKRKRDVAHLRSYSTFLKVTTKKETVNTGEPDYHGHLAPLLFF